MDYTQSVWQEELEWISTERTSIEVKTDYSREGVGKAERSRWR